MELATVNKRMCIMLSGYRSATRRTNLAIVACFLTALAAVVLVNDAYGALREIVSLDGSWQIGEGPLRCWMPTKFDHAGPVPGLVDMAEPPFPDIGTAKSADHRDVFWYRRTFQVNGPAPALARLKIHKACYGTAVYLNGQFIGEHLPCFTSVIYDVTKHLRTDGQPNDLAIRLGGYRNWLPPTIPEGHDGERDRFIPGIYDSVELILSGSPHIVRVQAVPEIDTKTVRVAATLGNTGDAVSTPVTCRVYEAKSGKLVGAAETQQSLSAGDLDKTVELRVPIENCRLWSPEDPFLYRLEVVTSGDTTLTRFGMRTFTFDAKTKHAVLNGKPYFLRGTNVLIFRFFEDSERGNLPWQKDWVRRLHEMFRGMNWNAARYCIGFPPDFWYDIADETGMLIQDEFPVWYGFDMPRQMTSDELVREYTEWMQERWNHPCVVLWDAQNETITAETGKAIRAVRGLDLSNRPWDNGNSPAQAPTDTYESHAYLGAPGFRMSMMASLPHRPDGYWQNVMPNSGDNPIIINEYCYYWLKRDGTPTTLTKAIYDELLGRDATVEQRRRMYARMLAAKTEFWRSHRKVAGVMEICALSYSHPNAATSDHFQNVAELKLEPNFEKYVRDAFAPVGLMLDFWDEKLPGGKPRQFPVIVVNDTDQDWRGQIRLRFRQAGQVVEEKTLPCQVSALRTTRAAFDVVAPKTAGPCEIEAALLRSSDASAVRSLRDAEITP